MTLLGHKGCQSLLNYKLLIVKLKLTGSIKQIITVFLSIMIFFLAF